MTTAEQRLVLETQIKERALIVYVNQSALKDDETLSIDYRMCLRDEIQNHETAIAEYKEALKQLK